MTNTEAAHTTGASGLAVPGSCRLGNSDAFRVKVLEEQLQQVKDAVVLGMNQLLDLKDLNTGVHSTRLAEWAVRVAGAMGVDESYQRDIEVAALLHDIGKIGVPDAILNKPGKLDPDEWVYIKRHSEYAWAVLRLLPGFERISLLVLHHHERMDGKGYPAGLRGREIPLGSRIVCLMDAFDAMISDRCYRPGLPLDEVVRRVHDCTGSQFDPEIVRLFLPLAVHDLPEISQIADPSIPASVSSSPAIESRIIQ